MRETSCYNDNERVMSFRDIAKELNTTRWSVYRSYNLAIKKIRERAASIRAFREAVIEKRRLLDARAGYGLGRPARILTKEDLPASSLPLRIAPSSGQEGRVKGVRGWWTGKGRTSATVILLTILLCGVARGSEAKKPRVLDKKFWTLTLVSVGATVADIEYTQWCLRNKPYFHENNPVYGRNPSRPRMYAIGIGVDVGLAAAGAYLKRKFRKPVWVIPQAVDIEEHTRCTIQNVRVPGWSDLR